jgi:hypothetical protein
MDNEPERPIERLLRAAAKKRRDEAGAPLELHPATRCLLQGEVARKHAGAGRESRSFFQVFGQLWPRFAWGLAILAVLAVGGYMFLPVLGKGKPPTLLTRNEPMPQARPAKEALPPPPVAPATIPPPAASATRANPSAVASADKPQPARPSPGPQIAGGLRPLPKDGLAAQTDVKMAEKLALADSPQPANRNKVAEAEVAAPSGTPAPAPVVMASRAIAQPSKSYGKPASVVSAPTAPASPLPVATTPAAGGIVTADESKKLAVDRVGQSGFAYKSLPSLASTAPSKPSSGTTDSLLKSAPVARKEAGSVSATQWFAQVAQSPKTKASFADKLTPAHPVLASFQVEQAGLKLRIVDSDGSVYSGTMQVATVARSRRSAKSEPAAAARPSQAPGGKLEERPAARFDSDQLAPKTYSFRVTGTNRSLQKKVVFTGNLLAATNLTLSLPVATNLGIGGGVGGSQTGSARRGFLPLLNSRISGSVVIGTSKPVEINASPSRP